MRLPCFWSCKASVSTISSPWPVREPADTDARNGNDKNASLSLFRARTKEAGARPGRSLPIPCPARSRLSAASRRPHQLVRGEAVEQAVAAGAPEVVLAAAAVGPTRGMRRIPRLGRGIVAQTLAVAVADHGGALGAARPVAAGSVLPGRESPPVHLRPRKNSVRIGRVADARNHGPSLGQRHLHAEFVVVAMKIIDVLSDDLTFEILPGAPSDAIAGIDGLRAAGCLGTEVRAPGLVACARPLRQGLALSIRAFQAAEIRAL